MGLGLLQAGIRRKLFVLALSLALPLGIVAAVRAVERLRSEQALLAERGLTTAKRAGQLLDVEVEQTKSMLRGLARLLDVNAPRARNDSLIQSLYGQPTVAYSNVWLVDAKGATRGALRPPRASLTDSTTLAISYIQRALTSDDVVVSQPERSLALPGAPWIIPFTLAVREPGSGRVVGVVGTGLQLDSLTAIRLTRDLPEGTVLTVLRQDGRVFLRSADMAGWQGRTFSGTTQMAQDLQRPDTVQQVHSLDGQDRLVARARLRSLDGMLYVGVPVSATLELARRQFLRDILFGALSTVLVGILALFMARSISAPLRELADAARDWTRGETARRLLVRGDDEIGVLSRAFNQLADTVQDRERALAESEARYRQLFASNPLPVVTWFASSGRVDGFNDAATAFYGEARVGAPDVRILDLITSGERDAFALMELPPVGATRNIGVWTLRNARGEPRRVEIIIGTFEREQEIIAAAVMLDLTDKLRAESDLELSREQLRQAQKMEALGSFAGGIAHDFNNYLSAIATNAELLQEDLPAGSSQRDDVQEILRSAQRAALLTRQILVFSRRQVAQEERLDVNEVLRELELMLRRMVGERVEIVLHLAEHLPPVLFDRGRLEQVIVNLAANARDAMRSGGVLTIATRVSSTDTIEISVTDTGDGIPESLRARIFDPFFTTKERGRGTGLGLAIVDSIVTSANGRIDVESAPGTGTRFAITLPITREAAGVPAHVPRDLEGLGGTEELLLVEDDPAVRASTASALRRAGYRVATSASGAEALALLATGSIRPTAMVSDVVMPGMSGPELAARIAEDRPEMRVVFMSGYADDDLLMEGLERHAINFVSKPFTRSELLQAVRRALDTPSTVA